MAFLVTLAVLGLCAGLMLADRNGKNVGVDSEQELFAYAATGPHTARLTLFNQAYDLDATPLLGVAEFYRTGTDIALRLLPATISDPIMMVLTAVQNTAEAIG